MILYEESKALERAIGEDAAQIISKVFERQGALVTMELPTKKDLADGLKANRSDFQTTLRESELRTQLEIEKVRAETEKIRLEAKETEARLKTEIEKIRSETEKIRSETEKIRAEVKETEARLKTEIEKIRSETEKIRVEGKETEARLKIEIAKIRYNLLIWQLGIGFGLAAIMAKGFGWLGF